jgi:flagellar biosynthesis/type III secretory pathway protein FliH
MADDDYEQGYERGYAEGFTKGSLAAQNHNEADEIASPHPKTSIA